MKNWVIVAAMLLGSWVGSALATTLCPDVSWAGGNYCTVAPDRTWVGEYLELYIREPLQKSCYRDKMGGTSLWSIVMKQSSFSDLDYDHIHNHNHNHNHKKEVALRERFLQEMDSIIPWSLLAEPIKRAYPKDPTGRPPVALESMLRIYLLQQWYGPSDPVAEDSLYDTDSMRRFVGVELSKVPTKALSVGSGTDKNINGYLM